MIWISTIGVGDRGKNLTTCHRFLCCCASKRTEGLCCALLKSHHQTTTSWTLKHCTTPTKPLDSCVAPAAAALADHPRSTSPVSISGDMTPRNCVDGLRHTGLCSSTAQPEAARRLLCRPCPSSWTSPTTPTRLSWSPSQSGWQWKGPRITCVRRRDWATRWSASRTVRSHSCTRPRVYSSPPAGGSSARPSTKSEQ